MIELLAENSVLRSLLLIFLFAVVAAVVYFVAQASTTRQLARERLADAAAGRTGPATLGSLRAERVEGAWLRLVNSIEHAGLSLVDTKDAALRQKLIAAGYTASYAPRLYTLIRLIMVVVLPTLVLILYWVNGSSPGIVKVWISLVVSAALGLYL